MNNPIIGASAATGANYIMEKNKGCRKFYNVIGIVLGIAFFVGGIFACAGDELVGAIVFILLGLILVIVFAKAMKQ